MSERNSSVLLAINGDCTEKTLESIDLNRYDTVVAVDGGLRHLHQLGAEPDWIIGDLDSISSSLLQAYSSVRQMVYPAQKDATDFELALRYLQERGTTHVTLLGFTGGRLDHVLTNLLLLGLPDWTFQIELLYAHGAGRVVSFSHSFRQALDVDSKLSLIPLCDKVSGITTSGLKYPLDNATMTMGSSLGMSNLVVTEFVSVSVETGKLLVLCDELG